MLPPPDQAERERALDAGQSILVESPAGSGKTDLLTRRFLRLLASVDDPAEIVAITFTNAAAAEMRHRILGELEKAAEGTASADGPDSPISMETLARRAFEHSERCGWNLLDLPSQLRITTIDAFCRELALDQPLLSGLGGGMEIETHPAQLYRRAARQTLRRIDRAGEALGAAVELLLRWRDNGWQELENQLVDMLSQRDRWMHDFVLEGEPDWEKLRKRLERPFAAAARGALNQIDRLFSQLPEAREEALFLVRYAFQNSGRFGDLAEMAEFPVAPFDTGEALEDARQAYANLAELLLTGEGTFRKQADKRLGFPADRKVEKDRLLKLIDNLKAIPDTAAALAKVSDLPPARYTDDDWEIVRASFQLLRHAVAELSVVFAETGSVDFIEVAQIAQRALRGADGQPTDAAIAVGDKLRHLLVDEFQDTSRRQHQLISALIAAWPDRPGRTCFVVGDPMQSIYFFRDADAELFPRVKRVGLEIPGEETFEFTPVSLKANFRTAPSLVEELNKVFVEVFRVNDGSNVRFSSVDPARTDSAQRDQRFNLHLKFVPQIERGRANDADSTDRKQEAAELRRAAQEQQVAEIVELIRSHEAAIKAARQARDQGEERKFRVAVLGRTRPALAPIAEALREAGIPFRSVDLEKLEDRVEVQDALALARALVCSYDRVAWLGVLRAPWCGLSLADLHRLTSDDDSQLLARRVPELLGERLHLLSEEGQSAADRVLGALESAVRLRATRPAMALGSWLRAVWVSLGGADCVDAAAGVNLDLLWRCIDRLPDGERDLLGPGLAEALKDLTAQPDPDASSECGVQLMTIHKSKGLEFEVVIIPELQANGGRGSLKMLSWLERGVEYDNDGELDPDEKDRITEFLIAPFHAKGGDHGKAKDWVDQAYRQRELQEMRRIFYVAATRAREELHLFARPVYKTESDGSHTLAEPSASLLATAWPALGPEIGERFSQWCVANPAGSAEECAPEPAEIESIAASGESNLITMPAPARPALLHRLPQDYRPEQDYGADVLSGAHSMAAAEATAPNEFYRRHEGGLASRALGTAVHKLLEELARLRGKLDWDSARAALGNREAGIAAEVRAAGVDQHRAARIAAQAMQLALSASRDLHGAWILSPHSEAASELSWSSVSGGATRTVQVDRLFRAGDEPLTEAGDCWWLVDYKTAQGETANPAATLAELRPLFAPQLEAYAEVLRKLHGREAKIRAALYYPRMSMLDWWKI